ncbi:MAG: hypothetical protein K2G12_09995, partial [Prevotella sp.]|nr:hypothetical protein [Prevotella sp.]
MSVNNTAIGSAIIIPDGLLGELDKVDQKIKQIQNTSRATANVFNQSFASMSAGLKTGILTQLQQVINQLGSVGQAAQAAQTATQNMGGRLGAAARSATNFGTSITGVVEAINRMAGSLRQNASGGFMSSFSTLIESISVRIRGVNANLRQTQTQTSATNSAAMQTAKAAKEQAQINLLTQQAATAMEKSNLEIAKQAKLQAQAA